MLIYLKLQSYALERMKASWQTLLLLHYYYICTGDVHGEISDAQGETPQTPLAAVEENIVMTQQRDKSWKCVDRNVVTPRYATPVPSATARATALQTSAFSDTFLGSASVQGWIKEMEHFAAAPRTDASQTSLLQILMQSFWSPRRRKKKKKNSQRILMKSLQLQPLKCKADLKKTLLAASWPH